MHYNWGLGVGHLHAHQSNVSYIPDSSKLRGSDTFSDEFLSDREMDVTEMGSNMSYKSDSPEMALDDRNYEGWKDVESDNPEDGDNNSNCDSEDNFEEIYEQ